jgi:hypothetical protein
VPRPSGKPCQARLAIGLAIEADMYLGTAVLEPADACLAVAAREAPDFQAHWIPATIAATPVSKTPLPQSKTGRSCQ